MATSSSFVRGEDEVEGIEFLEVMVASLMRFWVEASSLRYLFKLPMKSVMSNWCMIEISSTRSWVYTSQATCLIVGVIEILVVNGEFMITPRHSTWR